MFKALEDSSWGLNTFNTRETQIVVSLTTYGGRIHEVYKTIQSLFMQSVKADRIILWLAEDEFNPDNLPRILQQWKKRFARFFL